MPQTCGTGRVSLSVCGWLWPSRDRRTTSKHVSAGAFPAAEIKRVCVCTVPLRALRPRDAILRFALKSKLKIGTNHTRGPHLAYCC